MDTVTTISELREAIRGRQSYLKRIGFVPTMGYLHVGHEALMRTAHEECDLVVVSIFVNPTQFGPQEDFGQYPRDLAHDQALCERAGVDIIFHPDARELYPRGCNTWVEVEGNLTSTACGAARPVHFRGVTTVCNKLFNVVRPDRAYFGEKDFQQLQVIRRMVKDLFMPLTIVGVPTVREPDGLAMSSRNSYLGPTERQAARIVPRLWQMAQEQVELGELESARIVAALEEAVSRSIARLEYALVVDPDTLEPMRLLNHEARLLLAVQIGKTRLIDNAPLCPKAPPPFK
jgi:pantoate--beta-alanine ligase